MIGINGPTPNAGVLLLEAHSLEDASGACEAFGERLWSPETDATEIQSVLNYTKYLESGSGLTEFWIASQNGSGRTIRADGLMSAIEPSQATQLPILCTQSAPYSNETYADTSEKWQVTVNSNNENITGYEPPEPPYLKSLRVKCFY